MIYNDNLVELNKKQVETSNMLTTIDTSFFKFLTYHTSFVEKSYEMEEMGKIYKNISSSIGTLREALKIDEKNLSTLGNNRELAKKNLINQISAKENELKKLEGQEEDSIAILNTLRIDLESIDKVRISIANEYKGSRITYNKSYFDMLVYAKNIENLYNQKINALFLDHKILITTYIDSRKLFEIIKEVIKELYRIIRNYGISNNEEEGIKLMETLKYVLLNCNYTESVTIGTISYQSTSGKQLKDNKNIFPSPFIKFDKFKDLMYLYNKIERYRQYENQINVFLTNIANGRYSLESKKTLLKAAFYNKTQSFFYLIVGDNVNCWLTDCYSQGLMSKGFLLNNQFFKLYYEELKKVKALLTNDFNQVRRAFINVQFNTIKNLASNDIRYTFNNVFKNSSFDDKTYKELNFFANHIIAPTYYSNK